MKRIALLSSNPGRAGSLLRALQKAGHEIGWIFLAGNQTIEEKFQQQISGVEVRSLPTNLTDLAFHRSYASVRPRLAIIAGLSKILPNELIDIPELGTINLHAGRVPQYRGGSPLNWQIINGEKEIGISVLRVDGGIDTGPVLAETKFVLEDSDDIAVVHARANELFADLTTAVVSELDEGRSREKPQNDTQAAYWHQRNDSDGRIHWSIMTAHEVHNLVRALTDPYPGAHCTGPTGTVRVLRTSLTDFVLKGTPGRVVFVQKRGPYVVCRDRAILLLRYKVDGGESLKHGAALA